MKDIDEVLSFVLSRLTAIIFEIEQLKDKIKENKKYVIEIKEDGKVIQTINI